MLKWIKHTKDRKSGTAAPSTISEVVRRSDAFCHQLENHVKGCQKHAQKSREEVLWALEDADR